MAWAEPMKDKNDKILGYRGRYRDSSGNKQKVLDPSGMLFKRASDAKYAASEKEVDARRCAAVDHAAESPSITWGEWWDIIGPDRIFDSDSETKELSIVKLFLRPYWGDTPLNQITKKAVQAWINALAAGTAKEWKAETPTRKQRNRPPRPSAGYVQNIYSVFQGSLKMAVDADPPVLTATPCVGIDMPRRTRKRKQYIPMSEAPDLCKQLKSHYADAVDFGLEVGLRPGELCGLHVDQFDLDSGMLWATNVLLSQKRKIRSYPKDKDARRLPLSAKALEIFRRNTEGRDLRAGCGVPHLDGTRCESNLLFLVKPYNIAMNPNQLAWNMRNAAERAGIPRRGAYAIRRGYATRLARAGLDVFELADALGHEDIKLVREYVQETPGANERVLAALGDRKPLTVVEGGAGESGASGAAPGARLENQPVQDRAIGAAGDAG